MAHAKRKPEIAMAIAVAAPADNVVALPARPVVKRRALGPLLGVLGNHVLPPVFALLLIFALWQVLASGPGASLPPPSQIFTDSYDLIINPFFDNGGTDKGLGLHVLASLSRVAVGYAIAAIIGVGLGTLIGSSQVFLRAFDPIFQVLRTVPPLAWLPISLAAFRDAQPSAIFVIFITSVWPIIINTAAGIRNIPEDYRNVARVINLNPFEYFTRIMVPAAAPYIFTGLRIGIGLSWLAIVAAEMLIGGVGIGFFIWDAWNSSLISDIIVALAYVGLVGFVLDRTVALVGRTITRGTAVN
jgi:nitrate/nitrite transport system permease protein